MRRFNVSTKIIARTGMIAGLYLAITFLLAAISFGPVQVRIAEAFTLLPMIYPEAIFGLFLGCFLANLFGPYGVIDIIFGSLTTLLAALVTYYFRHSVIAYLSPILLNAFLVSLYLYVFFRIPYWPTLFTIGLGESIAVLALGLPLIRIVKKQKAKKGK